MVPLPCTAGCATPASRTPRPLEAAASHHPNASTNHPRPAGSAISKTSLDLTARSGLEPGIERFLIQLEESGASRQTILAYGTDLNQFARFTHPRMGAEDASLGNVTDGIVALFASELEARQMKPATVARKLSALRALFRFLVKEGVLTRNPAVGAGGGSPRRDPPDCLTPRQVEEALDAAAAEARDFSSTRDRAIAEVVYGGGLRLSELVSLNLTSLRLDEGEVVVARPGECRRRVPIGSKAAAALQAYILQRADLLLDCDMSRVDVGALFVNNHGKRLHRRSFQRIASRIASRIADRVPGDPSSRTASNASRGGNASGPRLLRNSYAAHLMNAGADAASVARLLGQSTVAAGSPGGEGEDTALLQAKYERAHPRSGHTRERGADRSTPQEQ